MKIFSLHIVISILLFGFLNTVVAQTDSLKFSLLRQYDIWHFENTTGNNKFYERVKGFKFLGANASIGGSLRAQLEILDRPMFQNTTMDNSGGLARGLFHFDVKTLNNHQFFLELGSSHSIDKDNPIILDRDRLYVNQLFLKFNTGDFNWVIGRENLNYGSRRLFAIREGPNVRLSFDSFRVIYNKKNVSSELLALSVVPVELGVLDNDFYQFDNYILGTYNTIRLFSETTLMEVYYLRLQQQFSAYVDAQGKEIRHSIGTRWEIPFGEKLIFNNEIVYQFGNIADKSIRAWTLSLQAKYQLSNTLEYEINGEVISGDKDQNDDRLNTFNPLYPDVAYFGRVARFAPYNLLDIHNRIQFKKNKWMGELGHYAFWRYSVEDGIYGSGGFLQYSPVNDERFVAQQLAFTVKYRWNKFLSTDLETNLILPEDFLKKQDANKILSYLLLTTTFTF